MRSGGTGNGTGAGVGVVSGALRRKFLSDTMNYVPAVLVPAAAGLAAVSIFTRIFPPAPYGLYAVVVAAVSIFTTVASGWIQQSILRFYPRYRTGGREDLFWATLARLLLLVTLGCTALFAVAFLAASAILGPYQRFYLPAAFLVLVMILFASLNVTFQARLSSGAFARNRVLLAAGKLGISLAIVLAVWRDPAALLLGSALAHALLLVPMKGVLRRRSRVGRPSFDLGLARRFAAYGFPMVGWVIGAQVLDLSDRFIIGALRGSEEVGVYSASYSLVSMSVGLLSAPILSAAHPLVMNLWEGGRRAEISSMVAEFSRYYLILVVPLVALLSILSREVAAVFLGEGFRAGAAVIPILGAGYLFWGWGMYGHKGLELMEKTKVMLALVLVSAGVNVALNILLVPRYGYLGAALATLLSFALYPLLVHRVSKGSIEWIVPWSALARIAASIVPAAAAAAVLKSFLGPALAPYAIILLAGSLASAVYLACLYLVGELGRKRGGKL